MNRVVVATITAESGNAIADDDFSLDVGIDIEFFVLDGLPSGTEYPFMTDTYPNSDLIA